MSSIYVGVDVYCWNSQNSPHVRESKIVLDSGFQVLDSSFCQWNLGSGFRSFVGFRIPWVIFGIPKPRISDSTSEIFRIPESGIPYMGWQNIKFIQWHNFLHITFTYQKNMTVLLTLLSSAPPQWIRHLSSGSEVFKYACKKHRKLIPLLSHSY